MPSSLLSAYTINVVQMHIRKAQFRDAIARMESLLEEEGRDSAAAIKELRDKAVSAKGRCVVSVRGHYGLRR